MASIRQEKVSNLVKQELSSIFQRETRTLCMGALVSVTTVRITPDLSYARVYLSIFGHKDKQAVFNNINANNSLIRRNLAKIIGQQVRKVPELVFEIDDSLDYAENIDNLLKK